MTHRPTPLAALLLALLAVTPAPAADPAPATRPAAATDWPAWRGPLGTGAAADADLPLTWSATENVVWKTPIPGVGHSSPIVSGGRIFVTTCLTQNAKRVLLCLDRADGKVLWEREVVTAPLERKNNLNSYASSTPATDGQRVYAAFLAGPKPVVACYDFDGALVWKTNPGTFKSVHGWATSPVLYKDLVIQNCDQDDVAFIVAFDKLTGQERWRADRPNRTRSYVNPVITTLAGRPQLLLSGSKCVASYDPDTGKQLWQVDGPTEQFAASLVWARGLVFVTGGFPEYHLMAIRPDGDGNVSKTHVVWHHKKTPLAAYVPSPVADESRFYVVNDDGKATCLDAMTGEKFWSERLGRHHSPSPVIAAGRIYFLDDDGVTHVVRASDKFERLAKNDLGAPCRASPAIAGGQFFIRTAQDLYCIGRK